MERSDYYKLGNIRNPKNTGHFRDLRNAERREARNQNFLTGRDGLRERNEKEKEKSSKTDAIGKIQENGVADDGNATAEATTQPSAGPRSDKKIVLHSKNPEKASRQEKYLQNFIEWRAMKKHEKGNKENVKKQPFYPAVSKNALTNKEKQEVKSQPLAPNVESQEHRRRSLFTVKPSPVKTAGQKTEHCLGAIKKQHLFKVPQTNGASSSRPVSSASAASSKNPTFIRPTKAFSLRLAKNNKSISEIAAATGGAAAKAKAALAKKKHINSPAPARASKNAHLAVPMKHKNNVRKAVVLNKVKTAALRNISESKAAKPLVTSTAIKARCAAGLFQLSQISPIGSFKAAQPRILSAADSNAASSAFLPTDKESSIAAQTDVGGQFPMRKKFRFISRKTLKGTPTASPRSSASKKSKRRSSIFPKPEEKQNADAEALPAAAAHSATSDGNENKKVTPPKEPDAERPSNYVSPYVTLSRGKVSLQKEREKRNSIYLQDPAVGTPPSRGQRGQEAKKNFNELLRDEYSVEARRALEAVRYFRQQLNDEIARLTELSNKWEQCKSEELDQAQAAEVGDMIDATVGQTRLLMSKKLMQFKGLVDRCEACAKGTADAEDGSEGTRPISPTDVEGFWSMVYLQVENVDKRFADLERWRANNWQDPDAVKPKPKPRAAKAKKAPTANRPIAKGRANSALKEMMRKMAADLRKQAAVKDAGDPVDEEAKSSTSTENAVVGATEEHATSTKDKRRSSLRIQVLNQSKSKKMPQNNRLTPVCIVVKDRKSMSSTPTILGYLSPSAESAKKRRSRSISGARGRPSVGPQNPLTTPVKPALPSVEISTPPNDQQSMGPLLMASSRKSILKTPGTVTKQRKSVIFNEQLSVKKCRFINYTKPCEGDSNDPNDSFNMIQQVPMDELPKLKELSKKGRNKLALQEDDGDEADATYRLRNRRVVLRPSEEIIIPQKEC